MAIEVIEAQVREQSGTPSARRYRREGKIPGVFYYHGEEAVPLLFDSFQVSHFLSETHGLLDLQIEGEKQPRKCVIKEIQYDPLSDSIIHLDLMGVTMGEKVQVSVPLILTGTPEGVKQGGILEHLTRDVEIECLPRHLPNQLEVDVSSLTVGESIQIKDLAFENVTILNDPNETVALVELPKAAIAAEVAAAEEAEAAAEAAAEEAEGADSSEKTEE